MGNSFVLEVKLFAAAAQRAGRRSVAVELPIGATVAQLRERLEVTVPGLAGLLPGIMVAVERQFAGDEWVLEPGTEVALIPPVSGGMPPAAGDAPPAAASRFTVTREPLSVDQVAGQVINPSAGAVVCFAGTVREFTGGRRTVRLEYEAYREMAEEKLAEIGREIEDQWPGSRVAITHRVGTLAIEDISVVIAVATPHRPEAFLAARHAIERLKEIVPVWKKEIFADGSEEWAGPSGG